MDAHFANQIGQKTIRTPNAVAFRGPARQYGSGGFGAFAMRMGRVAIPLVKQYVMPVAKEFGKNLLSSFVPEISNVISGRKKPKTVQRETLKKKAFQKPVLRPPPPLLQKELMLAHIHKTIASVFEIVRPVATPPRNARDGAGPRESDERWSRQEPGGERAVVWAADTTQ